MKPVLSRLLPLASLTLSVALTAASLPTFAAESNKDVTLKTSKVRDNIYMIEGANGFAGGNVAVSVGDDGLLVVDSLLKNMTDKLKTSLAKISNSELRYLLNTHVHGDHTGGNIKIGQHTPIIAHDNVRKRISQPHTNKSGTSPAAPESAWPVLTFNDSMTLYFNDDTVQLQHYPNGHTDGDSIIYFVKANVLHMGDEFFNGNFPYVDLSRGGSIVGLSKTIDKIVAKMPKDVLIIPGHGPLADLDDLREYQQMLQHSITTVRQGISAGKTLAQMQKAGLDKKWLSYGNGFISSDTHINATYLSIKMSGDFREVKKAHKHQESTHHH
ncbi:MAG: cyclase [Phenylobacterium sp.]|jgi:cyclase